MKSKRLGRETGFQQNGSSWDFTIFPKSKFNILENCPLPTHA